MASFRRIFLLLMLALTGWAAVVTAGAIVVGGSAAAAAGAGGREQEVMAWALKCVAAVGFLQIVSFAGLTAMEKGRWRIIAIAGMLAAAVMMVFVPIYIWWEVTSGPLAAPGAGGMSAALLHLRIERLIQSGLIITGVLCLVPFVMVPRGGGMLRVGRILQWTAVLYLLGASIVTLGEIWKVTGAERVPLAIATLLIPAGVCMMGVFILQKYFAAPPKSAFRSTAGQIELKCPRCGNLELVPEGADSRCSGCCLKISVHVEEPTCPNCGFNLFGLSRPVCPECGLALPREEIALVGATQKEHEA
jgi:hypothetical protein